MLEDSPKLAGLFNSLDRSAWIEIAAIAAVAVLLVRASQRALPWIANRLHGRARHYLLASVPLLRLVLIVIASGLILPIVIEPSLRNMVALLGAAGLAIGFALKDYVSSLIAGVVSAFAQVVNYRCEKLGVFDKEDESNGVLDTLFSLEEPKTGTDGTLSWTVDIYNPATGEDFVLGLKEITLPDGVTRPYSVWLSGNYPRALDGLTRILSLDMRVMDPAWIGMKLRKLLDYPEPLGDFMAFVPGTRRQQNWPSTVAYLAQLIIHRYAMLGVLDERGYPTREMGILESPRDDNEPKLMQGALCNECGNHTVIRKDGCDFCTACGAVGTCG